MTKKCEGIRDGLVSLDCGSGYTVNKGESKKVVKPQEVKVVRGAELRDGDWLSIKAT